MQLSRLNELISRFPSHRIAVLGDFFLDKYLEVSPELAEPSLETGQVAHQVIAVRRYPGAAGTVVNNLAALGASQLYAIGAVGDDGEAYDLCQGLNKIGCCSDGLLRCPELLTPTYLKPRDYNVPGLAGEHSRYDTKNRKPTPGSIVEGITRELEKILPQIDALLIMDQVEIPECGVVTSVLRDRIGELAKQFPKVIFWADSRRHIRMFRNVMIKANQFEAIHKLNPAVGEHVSLDELKRVVPELRRQNNATVFVTCGERGIIASDPAVELIPGITVTGPIDPTGAGDSASAGAVMSLCSGATPAEAALVANLVASTTIQQLGTTGTASPDQVRSALAIWREQNRT
jgi:sugar/nucleoside kinase (ribokinase family)